MDHHGLSSPTPLLACSVLAVGGPNDNKMIGAVWVFQRDTTSGNYQQVGDKLVVKDIKPNKDGAVHLGCSVSLSEKGNILAIGAYSDSVTADDVGSVYIYTSPKNDAVFIESQTLVPKEYLGKAPWFGWSVSLSGDGSTLAGGGPQDDDTVGATWIFKSKEGTFSQFDKLVGQGYIRPKDGSSVAQGSNVTLSRDGSLLAVAGPGDANKDGLAVGAAWAFRFVKGVYSQIGGKDSKLAPPDDYTAPIKDPINGGKFASSVAFSPEGSVLAIGGDGDTPKDTDNIGATWPYTFQCP